MNRLKAAFTHFLVSMAVVGAALAVVFFIWYPAPYGDSSDIWSMVKILICVDLILGPLITLIIFNTGKSRTELKRDLSIVATVQLLALGYGMHAMFDQRPEYLVFGVDRFESMTDDRVDTSPLHETLGDEPLVGPLVVFAQSGSTEEEKRKLIQDWMQGKGDFTTRREFYRPILRHVDKIRQRAVDPQSIIAYPANSTKAEAIAAVKVHAARHADDRIYLPLVGKSRSMLAAFDPVTGKLGPVFDLYPFLDGQSVLESTGKSSESIASDVVANQ